jgi:hypothetical protein
VSLSLSLFPLPRTLVQPTATAAPPPRVARPWAPSRIPTLSHLWQQGLRSFRPSRTRPRRGAPPGTGVPLPRITTGGEDPPLVWHCRGRGLPLTRRRHWGRGPLLGRRCLDEVLCSPTPGMTRSLAAAARGPGPLHYMFE